MAQKIPLPVVALGGGGVGVFALLKLMRLVGGGDFADSQARYRRCNRCAKRGRRFVARDAGERITARARA